MGRIFAVASSQAKLLLDADVQEKRARIESMHALYLRARLLLWVRLQPETNNTNTTPR
jgi:hypothetical protein